MGAITEAFKNEYHDVLQLLVQQKDTRLRGTVMIDMDFTGEQKFYDQLGQTAVVARTTRNQDTPVIDPDHDKRKVLGTDYLHAYLLDTDDEISMAVNPNTGYVTTQARAFARNTDKVIYTALLGNAYSGKAGTTANAIDTTVTCAGGMTVDKLLEIKLALDLNNVDPDDPRYFACTAYEIRDLLNLTEVKSSDYNTVKALAAGEIDSFCGFKFIVLPPTSVTNGIITRTANVNYCAAYTYSSLMLAFKRDLQSRITEESTKNFSTQFWAAHTLGAVRLQEEKVIAVPVTNAT